MTTLAANATASDLQMTFSADFPLGATIAIGDELIKIDEHVQDTTHFPPTVVAHKYHVSRGLHGTTAASHTSGATAYVSSEPAVAYSATGAPINPPSGLPLHVTGTNLYVWANGVWKGPFNTGT